MCPLLSALAVTPVNTVTSVPALGTALAAPFEVVNAEPVLGPP